MAKADKTLNPPPGPRRRTGGPLTLSAYKGQLVIKRRKARTGPKKSPAQQALVDQFSAIATWTKWADGAARQFAEESAAGTGWYWRDVITSGMVGKLLRYQEAPRISTPTANVHRTTGQAISGGAEVAVVPNEAYWDNNYFWSQLTNPSRLTVRTAGLYLVGAQLFWSTNTSNRRKTTIMLNGTTRIAEQSNGSGNSNTASQNLVALWYFNAADYVEVYGQPSISANNATLQQFWLLAITPETVVSP